MQDWIQSIETSFHSDPSITESLFSYNSVIVNMLGNNFPCEDLNQWSVNISNKIKPRVIVLDKQWKNMLWYSFLIKTEFSNPTYTHNTFLTEQDLLELVHIALA